MKIREIILEETWITPTNNKIIYYFETSQGSKYLLSDQNESKRNKSTHTNTSDTGLKRWYKYCIFVDSSQEYEANSPQFLANHFDLKDIKISVKNSKLALYHNDKILKFRDAYPKSGNNENLLVFDYIKTPTIGYNVVEFDLYPNNSIKSWHFGSEVSYVSPITGELIQKFKE